MDAASTRSVAYGNHPPKEPHRFSTNSTASPGHESEAARRVHDFMASKNGGGDPVTALGVRGETSASSVTARLSQVLHDANASLAQFHQSSDSNPASRP
ncbi:hypothetical protein F5X96DRAFT_44997 [Biscogniauxia mediterranea]|nr:hypothetical protein F5X96DRAFT_44997 [Biscogniauxia mediterranea]